MNADSFNKSADRGAAAPDLANLAEAASMLPEPVDCYAGICPGNTPLPENILCFLRKTLPVFGRPAHHYRYVLIVNLGGSGGVILDDLVFDFTPGNAIIIHPFQFHCYADVQQTELDWLFVTFEMPDEEYLLATRNHLLCLSGNMLRSLQNALNLFVGVLSAGGEPDERALQLELSLLLIDLLKHAMLPARPQQDRRRPQTSAARQDYQLVQTISRYLIANLAEPLTMAGIAANVSMSESHLRNRFREIMGYSLGQHIRLLRMHNACGMLAGTDASVTQVALACGYPSVYAFSRAFKTILGESPSKYREKLRLAGTSCRQSPSLSTVHHK